MFRDRERGRLLGQYIEPSISGLGRGGNMARSCREYTESCGHLFKVAVSEKKGGGEMLLL